MATTLFLLTTDETGVTIGSNTEYKLATVRGSGVANRATTSTAGGNHIVATNGGGGATMIWLYRVNAVTISSTVTFNFWGLELTMNDNVGMAAIVSRYNSAGTFVSDVVAQGNAGHADGVELGTSTSAMNWTATPTSTSFNNGDWLAVIVHCEAVGVMAAGQFTLNVNGTSAGVFGDTFVTFTETITEFVASADYPNKNIHQLLAH